MILVLSVFIASLFDRSHTPSFWISKLTKFIRSSNEEPLANPVVSSAK